MTCPGHVFKFAKLGINDTVHFQIKPQPEKFRDIPPKIIFVFRYLDSGLKCYHRLIPLDCQIRPNDPEALFAAAAVKVGLKQITPQQAIAALIGYDLSPFDQLFRSRFQFALRGLHLIPLSASLTNFVIGRSPSEIFHRVSPLALELGADSWRAVNEVRFQYVPVLLQRPCHYFLIVLPDGDFQGEAPDWNAIVKGIDKYGTYGIVRPGDVATNCDWREITFLLSMK
jgi:hypothetical protein